MLNWNYERWRTRDRLQEYDQPPYPKIEEEKEDNYGEYNDEERPAR